MLPTTANFHIHSAVFGVLAVGTSAFGNPSVQIIAGSSIAWIFVSLIVWSVHPVRRQRKAEQLVDEILSESDFDNKGTISTIRLHGRVPNAKLDELYRLVPADSLRSDINAITLNWYKAEVVIVTDASHRDAAEDLAKVIGAKCPHDRVLICPVASEVNERFEDWQIREFNASRLYVFLVTAEYVPDETLRTSLDICSKRDRTRRKQGDVTCLLVTPLDDGGLDYLKSKWYLRPYAYGPVGNDSFDHIVSRVVELLGVSQDRCFLSYHNEDEAFASRLATRLREMNVPIWFALQDLRPGADFRHEIKDQVEKSTWILFVISSYSSESEWQALELKWGITGGVNPIPVAVVSKEDVLAMQWQIPFDNRPGSNSAEDLFQTEVKNRHIADFSKEKNFESELEKLFAVICSDADAITI
jgi:hypothetical protein